MRSIMHKYPEAKDIINQLQDLCGKKDHETLFSIKDVIFCQMKQEKGCDLDECLYHSTCAPTRTTLEGQCNFPSKCESPITITKMRAIGHEEITKKFTELSNFISYHVPRYYGRDKCELQDITIDDKTLTVTLTWSTTSRLTPLKEQVHIAPVKLTDKRPTFFEHYINAIQNYNK